MNTKDKVKASPYSQTDPEGVTEASSSRPPSGYTHMPTSQVYSQKQCYSLLAHTQMKQLGICYIKNN